MVGVTNCSIQEILRCKDEHTLFLMTSDLKDRSMYDQTFDIGGQVWPSKSIGGRDGRPAIMFNPGYIRIFNSNMLNGGHNWTIEAWVNVSTSTSSAICWQVVSGPYYGLLWGYAGAANTNLYLSTDGSSWNVIGGLPSTNVGTGVWAHRALVHDGTTILCFTNGILTHTYNSGNSWTFTGFPYIGRYYDTNFSGFMQDYRISDVARYTSNFTPPERFLPI